MTPVIPSDDTLIGISNGHCSSSFGSARTHQSIERKTSNRIDSPRSDSPNESLDEPSFADDTGQSQAFPIGVEDILDPSTVQPPNFGGGNIDAPDSEIVHGSDDDFTTLIRSHGVPLDTITERTSFSTIQEPTLLPILSASATSRALKNIDRKSSAPDAVVLREWQHEERRLTQSLDETILETLRSSSEEHSISEAAESLEPGGRVEIMTPPLPPIPSSTPSEQRRICDVSSTIPISKSTANRRTSAYVRDIYHKLVGTSEHDNAPSENKSPSKIPVPTSLSRCSRTVQASPKPFEDGTKRTKLHDISSGPYHFAERIEDRNRKSNSPISNESPFGIPRTGPVPKHEPCDQGPENTDALGAKQTKLSSLLGRTGCLFASPKARSTRDSNNSIPKSSASEIAPTAGHKFNGLLQHASDQADPSAVERTGWSLSPPPYSDTSLAPQLVTVWNKSIFDTFAPDRPQSSQTLHTETSPRPLATTLLSVHNDMPASRHLQTQGSSTPNSWDLPLGPFPQPPSPNQFQTPPSSCGSRDEPDKYRYTSNQVPIDPRSAPTLLTVDKATGNSVVLGIAASNSSISLVARQSLSQRTPNCLSNHSDPFISRSIACTVDGTAAFDRNPYRDMTPPTPIRMPSPLRPRAKLGSKYSLFPSEEDPAGPAKPAAKASALRNFRSLSSMLRVPSATMRASTSSDLKPWNTTKICPHGKPLERVDVFSGRKLGSKAWRLRHLVRDGGLSCNKCRFTRLRARLRTTAARLFSGGRRGIKTQTEANTTTENLPTAVVAVSSSANDEKSPPPPGVKEDGSPLVVKHPLEEVEERRRVAIRGATRTRPALRRKVRALGGKVRALASRWATWAPTGCFCMIVDDASSGVRTGRGETMPAVRHAHTRRVID